MKRTYDKLWSEERFRTKKNRLDFHAEVFESYLAMMHYCGVFPRHMTGIDWGCGNGSKSVTLKIHGHDMVCNDISKAGFEADLPFEEAPLHRARPRISFFSMCLDVLEHVPEEDVEASIANIYEHTQKCAFFSIDCRTDKWEGIELHKTIRPPEWWKERINPHGWRIALEYIMPKRPTIGICLVKE